MAADNAWVYTYDTAFLQAVSNICDIPSAFMTGSVFWHSTGVNQHPFQTDPQFLKKIDAEYVTDDPAVYMENEYVVWGLLRLGGYLIALGPSAITKPSDKYDQEYATVHGMDEFIVLKKTTLSEIGDCLSLLSCHFFGSSVPHERIKRIGRGMEHYTWETEGELSHYHLSQSENDRSHKSGIAFENAVAAAVRNGEVEQIKRLLSRNAPNFADGGVVADEEQKQLEYMIVSLLTILTRAAEEGGLPSELAHEVGDIYLKRLAKASTTGGISATLGLRAMTEFAELVRKVKEERRSDSHIAACKAYIEENLLKGIEVNRIAPAIGLSRTYLARLFKKEEGITVQQYIQREKCRHAERLLKYSDYSIALISEYVGFSSPGYFGNCFQQWYGITPSKYRRLYARK